MPLEILVGPHPFHRFYSITQPRNSAGKFKGPRLGNCDTNFSAVLVLRLGIFPRRNPTSDSKQNMLDKDKRECLWNLVSFFGWTMKILDFPCIFSCFCDSRIACWLHL